MPKKPKPSAPALVSPPQEHPKTFTDGLPLPKLLIFDLDYTLWPFWIDTHVTPPLRPYPPGHASAGLAARDGRGTSLSFYPEVPGVLRSCRARGILVGAASRTYTPDLAKDLLGMLEVSEGQDETKESDKSGVKKRKAVEFFDALQIFPADKVVHMKKLATQLGVAYDEMLFFDDEERNRNVERELGVCFWLVRDGVSRGEIDAGVDKWRRRRGKNGGVGVVKKGEVRGVDVSLVDGDEE